MSFIHNIKKFFDKDEQLLLEGNKVPYDVKKKRKKKVVINGEKYEMLVDYSSKLSNLNREIIDKTEKSDKINKEIDGKITEVVTTIDEESLNLRTSLNTIKKVVTEFRIMSGNVNKIENLTNESVTFVNECETIIKNLCIQMDSVNEKIEEVADKISVLSKRTEKIDLVNDTFKSIYTQINLIALNAALESEKQEEKKQGFIDVAQNLKKLSEQTGLASIEVERYNRLLSYNVKEVFDKIKAGVAETNRGYRMTQQVKASYGNINERVNELDKLVQATKLGEEDDNFTENIIKSLNVVTERTRKSVESGNRTLNVNEEQRKELDTIKALSHELAGINKQIESELNDIVQKKN